VKAIVGLGNPGARYAETRHNVGFMVVSRLADRWKISLNQSFCSAKAGTGVFAGEEIGLALPQTMMNGSGESVGCLIERWGPKISELLVVYDEVDLPLGSIRLRPDGSHAGHKGIASILERLQTEGVPRLRVGIRPAGKKEGDMVEFVLDRFEASEKKLVEEGLASAQKACEVWAEKGMQTAMNLFNKKGSQISTETE
jgi:PTH1 family peptidyl-tRNA hydrolase